MKQVEPLYNWLATLEDAEADHILAAGLEHADASFVARIITTLLGRKTELAWKGLASNYDRLDDAARAQLLASDEALLRAGVAAALKSETPRHRQNALALLTEHQQPQLAHLASDALRDVLPAIRETAAQIIRASAERILAPSAAADGGTPGAPLAPEVRTIVIEALRAGLHSFDVHFRLEILEASLWFAKDLRETLWNVLGTRRSHAAYAVTEQLPAWDHPRLASFVLIALGWPSWRWSAQEVLDRWSTREQLLAILRNSDLLADPQVRDSLHVLRSPAWLAAAGSDLAELTPEDRALVPQWLCHLGYSDEDRVRVLARWRLSRYPEVQRAAIYALAKLENREALRILADVAVRPGPMMQFARWVLAGRRATAVANKGAAAASAAENAKSTSEVDAWAKS
jgi:hypothetical protein